MSCWADLWLVLYHWDTLVTWDSGTGPVGTMVRSHIGINLETLCMISSANIPDICVSHDQCRPAALLLDFLCYNPGFIIKTYLIKVDAFVCAYCSESSHWNWGSFILKEKMKLLSIKRLQCITLSTAACTHVNVLMLRLFSIHIKCYIAQAVCYCVQWFINKMGGVGDVFVPS